MKPKIILSFDVEEFDTPLEYGRQLPLDEQMRVSERGLRAVLHLLEGHGVRATFFTTARFALHHRALVRDMARTHEIASHGYYHSSFEDADLRRSKDVIESITGRPVLGYRMARMMPVCDAALHEAGYAYNSSLHPTWLPGRYNHLDKPRTPFLRGGVRHIPASVTPLLRFPVFWLSFKNFPLSWMRWATQAIWRADGCANFYFHPWEFTDITDKVRYGLPGYVSRHSAGGMVRKLDRHIAWARPRAEFVTFADWNAALAARPA